MKIKVILLLIVLTSLLSTAFSANRTKYKSVQIIATDPSYKVKLASKGGFQGFCMQLQIENNSNDTCFAWVEAGRRLISKDDKQQDIFIVKNAYVVIAPKQKRKFDLFGFCCKSHNSSPKAGSIFFVGKMEESEWQKLANVIDAGDYDQDAIQSAVWSISNDHPSSSINRGKNNKNFMLLKTIADIKHETIPWYNMGYQSTENQVFSNIPSHIRADINYKMAYNGEISIVVFDKNGILQTTLLDEIPKNQGKHLYFLDLNVKGWKDGVYSLQVIQDGNKIIEKKEFKIDTSVN